MQKYWQSQKEKELYNEAGYICTYIADLYDFRDMQKEARHQYEEAQGLFKKAGNIKRSCICFAKYSS